MSHRTRGREPEIEFSAQVEAEELYFTEAARSHVEFTGNAGPSSSSGSRRTGVPDRVDEGVTYHRIRVDYRIRALLDD